MRISEILARTRKVLDVKPSAVQRQARINQVVSQIAASDQQQQPTEMDKVMAMRRFANMKNQVNQNYLSDLQQQVADLSPKRRKKR